jgi:hypothetical protein
MFSRIQNCGATLALGTLVGLPMGGRTTGITATRPLQPSAKPAAGGRSHRAFRRRPCPRRRVRAHATQGLKGNRYESDRNAVLPDDAHRRARLCRQRR